jgi:hypothetical protein
MTLLRFINNLPHSFVVVKLRNYFDYIGGATIYVG